MLGLAFKAFPVLRVCVSRNPGRPQIGEVASVVRGFQSGTGCVTRLACLSTCTIVFPKSQRRRFQHPSSIRRSSRTVGMNPNWSRKTLRGATRVRKQEQRVYLRGSVCIGNVQERKECSIGPFMSFYGEGVYDVAMCMTFLTCMCEATASKQFGRFDYIPGMHCPNLGLVW